MAKYKLWAPAAYWSLDKKLKEEICNGAGPKGLGWLVPDRMYRLKITDAANIHDYMYSEHHTDKDYGWSEAGRKKADRVFLNNMTRIIKAKTKWAFIRILRLRRAKTYYQAVRSFGGMPYWHGKNNPEEEK
jgi:hypothetical protein